MADDGPATFALDAAAPGLEVEKQRLVDGGFAATLRLDRTPVPGRRRLHSGAIAAPALERALDVAALAAAAEMVGIMDAAFSMTLDYLRTRVQFDRPIGSLQALQHRAADLRIQLELARASVEAAANALDAGADARARATAVSAAKARASEAALLITRQAIQLQGAIGYTEEADVGLYLKRAMVLANGFGTASAHRRRFAALAAPEQEEALT
jgi:alkylation response protein AidB-like acyl-CoA dehydrogenase